ncbi:MAG: ATP-dependent Clp protease proteolytic subunit [Pseudomonadota bacterium]
MSVFRIQTLTLLAAVFGLALSLNAHAEETATAQPVNEVVILEEDVKAELERLRQENVRLQAELQALQVQQNDQNENDEELLALEKLRLESERLKLENALQEEKNRQELLALRHEREKLVISNELQTAKESQMFAELNTKKTRLELENTVREQERKSKMADVEREFNELAVRNALREEKHKEQTLDLKLEGERLKLEFNKLKIEQAKRTDTMNALNEKITTRERKETWESQVNRPVEYFTEPLKDGKLFISDRRIMLEGPIIPGIADYVNERLHYFNNKDTDLPIFLVITDSPGGSVMEGERIIRAMKASRAPVHVVVESFAASMAAVITAMADRSYAYPNALILHHQLWGFTFGNVTEQAEYLELTKQWSRRLMIPVAEKMGMSLDEFVAKMYENSSTGDWQEFGDKALEYKWVDHVIIDIVDESYKYEPLEPPEQMHPQQGQQAIVGHYAEQVDSDGRRYVKLPHLNPSDLYFLYNPNKYYR